MKSPSGDNLKTLALAILLMNFLDQDFHFKKFYYTRELTFENWYHFVVKVSKKCAVQVAQNGLRFAKGFCG